MTEVREGAEKSAPFNLREIKAGDTFKFIAIISKIGITNFVENLDEETLKALKYKQPMVMKGNKLEPLPQKKWTEGQKRAKAKADIALSKFAINILSLLVENLPSVQNDLFDLLADSYQVSIEDVKNLSGSQFIDLLAGYVDREEFTDFFKHVLKLVGIGQKVNL